MACSRCPLWLCPLVQMQATMQVAPQAAPAPQQPAAPVPLCCPSPLVLPPVRPPFLLPLASHSQQASDTYGQPANEWLLLLKSMCISHP